MTIIPKSVLFISLLVFFTSGCSVIAAANGSEDPDLQVVKVGALKPVVDAELGEPIREESTNTGPFAHYVYSIGDEPAPGRAFLYLLGDIVTLFYAEYLFTPMEAANGGEVYDMFIKYSAGLKAQRLFSAGKGIDPMQVDYSNVSKLTEMK